MNSQDRISRKISKLRHEGKPQREAIGMAMGMARKNRITKSGGYRRIAKKGRRKRHGKRYNRNRSGGR